MKTPMLETSFNKIVGLQILYFKNDSISGVLISTLQIFKDTSYVEHSWKSVSVTTLT